jgi:hypothetical protein
MSPQQHAAGSGSRLEHASKQGRTYTEASERAAGYKTGRHGIKGNTARRNTTYMSYSATFSPPYLILPYPSILYIILYPLYPLWDPLITLSKYIRV